MRRALLPLLLVSACLNADNWPDKAAKASCDFSKRCATANFWSLHDDMGACIDESALALQNEAADKADCLFDKDAAKACLDALKGSCKDAGAEAETVFEPCYAVYDCGTVDSGS